MQQELLSQAASEVPHPLRVLLVEDDPEYARLVARALVPAGPAVRIEHVTTLGAALVEQQRAPADVVLLDLGLPDATPAQTTESAARLRRAVPVFVLTSRDDAPTALSALDAGIEDYLVKGQLDPANLSTLLRAAVERRQDGPFDAFSRCVGPSDFRSTLRERIADLGESQALSVSVLSLDYFDTLRATWGEPWARRMLRSTADALQAAAGEETLVARLHDGAFAILDGGRTPSSVLLQESLSSEMPLSPEVSHRERYSVTASYGTAIAPDDGTHPATLIECARERAEEAFHRSADGLRFRLGGGRLS